MEPAERRTPVPPPSPSTFARRRTEVVPWVPLMNGTQVTVVSDRVVRYSFDQFTFLPALDQIALAPGSD